MGRMTHFISKDIIKMAKVKFPLTQVLNETYSAMTDKHPRYKQLERQFKKRIYTDIDYEEDLKKEKKKKLKEDTGDLRATILNVFNSMKTLNANSKISLKKLITIGFNDVEVRHLMRIFRLAYIKYDEMMSGKYDDILFHNPSVHTMMKDKWEDFKDQLENIDNRVIKLADVRGFSRTRAMKIAKSVFTTQNEMDMMSIPDIWPMGVEGAKEETKEIRKTAKKLPKKTMKLEDTLSEETEQDQMVDILKKRLPGVKRIRKFKNRHIISFYYKDEVYNIYYTGWGKKYTVTSRTLSRAYSKQEDRVRRIKIAKYLDKLMNSMSKEETVDLTKKIRETATKLPKKTMKLEDTLIEGAQDRGIFKAIFLAGGPGSGKSTISSKILDGTVGWKRLNTDQIWEFLLKKENISLAHDERSPMEKQRAAQHAKTARKKLPKQEEMYIKGRLPLLIDRTAVSYRAVIDHARKLESIGYDVGMIFVDTNQEEAKRRNEQRERKLNFNSVKGYDSIIRRNIPKFEGFFGNNFWHIDNSKPFTKERELTEIRKIREKLFKWISAKPKSLKARDWIEAEKKNTIKRK